MNRRTLRSPLVLCLILALGLAVATPSHAYQMLQNTATGRVTAGFLVPGNDPGGFAHWSTCNMSWYHNTANQGSGKAAALQSAMASWNNVAEAGQTLTYAGTTTAGWATDGVNTLLWAAGNGCTGSCLALTALVLQSGQVIVESDVTFNNSVTWTTNGSNYDTEAVAAHEFGHTLGIHHTDVGSSPEPTMTATYFGSGGRSLEADDQQALQCSHSRYPACGSGAPTTPFSLTLVTHVCWGRNSASWSLSCGATYYELYGSASSDFASQWLEYSGPDLSRFLNVSQTSYFRVRACNAAGCSGYRVGNQPAYYFNHCF